MERMRCAVQYNMLNVGVVPVRTLYVGLSHSLKASVGPG